MIMPKDKNLTTYNKADVVEHYDNLEGLTPGEVYLFDKYIKPGSRILDIGVGGGRTTPILSKHAKQYIGIDYADAMVHVCRKKFPNLRFYTMDASDLSEFSDLSFYKSMPIAFRVLRSQAFYSDHGYRYDPSHGGLLTHVSTPQSVINEAHSVIHNYNGFVVWNDDELLDAVEKLTADRDLLSRMGKASAEMAKDWDWDKVAPQWLNKIQEVISVKQ
jgi:SAM-dependent methyltransferase